MVMATGNLCHPYDTGDLSHEVRGGTANREAAAEAAALHERLVAYVHALAPPHEARSGVWVEHSYARARGAAHAPASHVRVLLAPRVDPPADPAADLVDVEREDPPPPSPPAPPERSPPDSDAESGTDEEWEPRVTALAPGVAHAALAEHALEALRRLRLARLACGRAALDEHLRVAARRLRHALAAPGAAAPWLHATLLAHLPRGPRRLYDALVGELARAAPRLAARLAGGRAPPPRREPLAVARPARGADGAGPWLVWLGSGSERQDRRWRRRLGALLHVRALPAPAPGAASPEAWCASVAGSMRAALAETLAEAGSRAVVLGGAGAGAALCAALAAQLAPGAVRGVLLLAPPLLTAEGAREPGEDPLGEVRAPLLLVAGTGASAAPLGALRGAALGARGRRVLEVRGADDALRLPAAARLRRRLPQHALDAAVAEECARWALDAAEGLAGAPPPPEHEEYAHLPEPALVSRGSGATPLALLPPRRAAPAPALAAADIMRLPIVFADDEPGAVPAAGARGRGRVLVAARARPLLLRRTLRLVPPRRGEAPR